MEGVVVVEKEVDGEMEGEGVTVKNLDAVRVAVSVRVDVVEGLRKRERPTRQDRGDEARGTRSSGRVHVWRRART